VAAAWGVSAFISALEMGPEEVKAALNSGHCLIFALEDGLSNAKLGNAWTMDFVVGGVSGRLRRGLEGVDLQVPLSWPMRNVLKRRQRYRHFTSCRARALNQAAPVLGGRTAKVKSRTSSHTRARAAREWGRGGRRCRREWRRSRFRVCTQGRKGGT